MSGSSLKERRADHFPISGADLSHGNSWGEDSRENFDYGLSATSVIAWAGVQRLFGTPAARSSVCFLPPRARAGSQRRGREGNGAVFRCLRMSINAQKCAQMSKFAH